jgi:PAS domain S-box-containing protein
VTLVYAVSIFLFGPAGSLLDPVTFSLMAVLVIIGWVVSLLARNLARSERQFHDIIEFLPDATFAIDRDGRVIAWNRAVEEMTGIDKSTVLGRGNFEYALAFYNERRPMLAGLIISGEPDPEKRYPAVRRESGRLESAVYLPQFFGGKGAHLRFSATALLDANGNITGAIESVRDISAQVITREALRNTSDRLNTLAGIMRNDMSRKLAVLYVSLRLGVMKIRDPEVIAFLSGIKDAADGIMRQIDISREYRDIGTNPPAWIGVQEAFNEAAGRLETGRMTFRAWTGRLMVFSDPHLPTVFYHILHNSVNPGTGATMIIATYHLRPDGCAIIIEDNGTGIPDDVKQSLFVQREDSYGRGLFLAHEIVSITGITIRETGTYGEGARFEILVPPSCYRIEGVAE